MKKRMMVSPNPSGFIIQSSREMVHTRAKRRKERSPIAPKNYLNLHGTPQKTYLKKKKKHSNLPLAKQKKSTITHRSLGVESPLGGLPMERLEGVISRKAAL